MKAQMRYNNPYIIGIIGVIMTIFGIAAIVNPEITLKTIIRFFGIIILISGIFLVILIKWKSNDLPEFWFYEGIANIIIGLLFVFLPAFITNIFVIFIGLLTLIVGIRNLSVLVRDKHQFLITGLIRNIILIGFGLLFLFVPFKGAKLIINIIGIFALLYGVVTVYSSYKLFQLRSSENKDI